MIDITQFLEYIALAVVISVVLESMKAPLNLTRFAHHKAGLRLTAIAFGWLGGVLIPSMNGLFGAAAGALSTAVYWAVKRKLRASQPDAASDSAEP